MADLRIALFVEGSEVLTPRQGNSFQSLWVTDIVNALQLRRPHAVYPISKKHLVAMDPSQPKMSGASEALDQFMARMLIMSPFDAAVVVWDLLPPWDRTAEVCRWEETLSLYRGLANSTALPGEWRDRANERLSELTRRSSPSARTVPPVIGRNVVGAVCMEPVFEALVINDESLVREALETKGKQVKDWPVWDFQENPHDKVLGKALTAVSRLRPAPGITKRIPPSIRTHKTEWGAHLVRFLASRGRGQEVLRNHPIGQRLREVLRKQ